MPPGMTAGLIPLAGLPLGETVSGKPAAGPPNAGTLSVSLFAALLAQSGSPHLKADISRGLTPNQAILEKAVPKELIPKETVPNETVTRTASQTSSTLPALTLPLGPVLNPRNSVTTPAIILTVAMPTAIMPTVKPLVDVSHAVSGSLKTMDTLPRLSSLPVKKAKDPAGELSLLKTSADTPGAASLISVPTPVPPILVLPTSVLPTFAPPILISVSPAAPAVKTSLPVQIEPLQRGALLTPPAVGPMLPRTFALTAPASIVQSVSTIPVPAMTMPAIAMPTGSGVPTFPAAQARREPPTSKEQAAAPAAPKSAAAISVPKSPISAAPGVLRPIQIGFQETAAVTPQMAAATPLPITAGGPAHPPMESILTTVPSSPAAAATLSSLAQPAATGPDQGPPKPNLTQAVGKALENPLKSQAGTADNNTRMPRVEAQPASAETAMPSARHETVLVQPEKPVTGRTASASSETGEANTLPGVQAPATVVEPARPETKPLSAAERAEVVRQVADGVGAMPLPARPGPAQQMSLQLHPKDWGRLQVSVSVVSGPEAGSAKTVTAHIVAETPQVKAALQSQTGALHQALRASGLHLEHLTVSVKPAEAKTLEAKTLEAKTLEAKTLEFKPAAESASAGMSSRQDQPNMAGQSGANMDSSKAQAGQSSGFASFAGSSQNGRQGQPPPAFGAASAMPEPDLEEMPARTVPLHSALGRIDTRA